MRLQICDSLKSHYESVTLANIMSSPVHVTALDALIDFRNAFCTFASKAVDALGAVDMQMQRHADWLDDQARIWKQLIRKYEDAVIQAQRELRQRKIFHAGDREPDCTEQELALRRAKMRLASAEERMAVTIAWQRKLPQVVDQISGPIRRLKTFLETDVPRAVAQLDHAISALDEYLRVQSPGG